MTKLFQKIKSQIAEQGGDDPDAYFNNNVSDLSILRDKDALRPYMFGKAIIWSLFKYGVSNRPP